MHVNTRRREEISSTDCKNPMKSQTLLIVYVITQTRNVVGTH